MQAKLSGEDVMLGDAIGPDEHGARLSSKVIKCPGQERLLLRRDVEVLKAVIFDFEGTLVDFQWRLEEAEAELRSRLEALGFDLEDFKGDNYARLWNRAIRLSPPERLPRVMGQLGEVYDRYDQDALKRWSPRDGSQEVLEVLRGEGIGLGVVTNVGRAAEEALLRLGLRRFLDVVITREDVRFLKPDPEGLRRCLRILGSSPREALFVGDSPSDLQAARAVGVPVALVLGGEGGREELEDMGPDHLLSSLREVVTLVATLEEAPPVSS